MEPSKGLVVRAMAGRDRGGYFVVVDAAEGFAWIADGKRRKLAAPKRKKIRHLQSTRQTVPMEDVTDKKLMSSWHMCLANCG